MVKPLNASFTLPSSPNFAWNQCSAQKCADTLNIPRSRTHTVFNRDSDRNQMDHFRESHTKWATKQRKHKKHKNNSQSIELIFYWVISLNPYAMCHDWKRSSSASAEIKKKMHDRKRKHRNRNLLWLFRKMRPNHLNSTKITDEWLNLNLIMEQ